MHWARTGPNGEHSLLLAADPCGHGGPGHVYLLYVTPVWSDTVRTAKEPTNHNPRRSPRPARCTTGPIRPHQLPPGNVDPTLRSPGGVGGGRGQAHTHTHTADQHHPWQLTAGYSILHTALDADQRLGIWRRLGAKIGLLLHKDRTQRRLMHLPLLSIHDVDKCRK